MAKTGDNPKINRFGMDLTDAAFTGNVSSVQDMLNRGNNLTYLSDIEYTTALHELLKRIITYFSISDPKRYTFNMVDKLKKYFKIAKFLRDHVTTEHERECRMPLAHIILKERSGWTLTEQVATNLLKSIATTSNLNYLLYSRDELVNLLCYELVVRAITPHNINFQDPNGNTALHLAVRHKQWKLVRYLVAEGADKGILDEYGFSVVNQLQFPRKPDDTLIEMLGLLITPKTLNRPGLVGNTLLHRATFVQSHDQIRYLLDRGADINLMNDKRYIALDIAIKDAEGRVRPEPFPIDIVQRLVPDGNLTIYELIAEIVDSKYTKKYAEILQFLLLRIDPRQHMQVCIEAITDEEESEYPMLLMKLSCRVSNKGTYSVRDRRSVSKFTLYVSNRTVELMSLFLTRTCIHITAFPRLTSHICNEELDETFRKDLVEIRNIWGEYEKSRMKFKEMCLMNVLCILWKHKGDASQLLLPMVIKDYVVNFDKEILQKLFDSDASTSFRPDRSFSYTIENCD